MLDIKKKKKRAEEKKLEWKYYCEIKGKAKKNILDTKKALNWKHWKKDWLNQAEKLLGDEEVKILGNY